MGKRDPPSGDTTPVVDIKVHPRREDDDAAVHPGRAGIPRPSPPPPASGWGTSPLPTLPRTPAAPERGGDGDFWLFKRWRPWLIPCFVVVNIVLFLVSMFINNCPRNSLGGLCVAKFLGRFSFQPLKENPLFGPSSYTLDKMGALDVNKVVHEHQAWRLISCIWLHGGVIHLLANMLSLVFIGVRLEQEFGFVRIGFLYVISGFGGSLLSALFIQSGISVGASGALFGLLGGMLSELLINWTIYANKLAALLTLIVIIVINLAVGILPHVDNFAHLGGFISGFLLGFVFLIRPQFKWISEKKTSSRRGSPPLKYKHKPYQYALWVISFILLTSGMITGFIFLLRDVNLNDYCSWCHYLTCIPTSKWSCKAKEIYCESTQIGNHLNITCLSNGRSDFLPLSSSYQSQQLCTQLCR